MEPRTNLAHRPYGTALHFADRVVLCAIAFLVVMATSVAFIESFDGLLKWSEGHGLSGWRAYIWPLQLDAFIAIGEGALFIAVLRNWNARGKIFAWTVTLAGAAVSIAANVGHVGASSWTDQATAAVPPLAACGGLTIGLQILKRTIHDREKAAQLTQAPAPEETPVVTVERVENQPGPLRRGWQAVKQVFARPVDLVPETVPVLPAQEAVEPVPALAAPVDPPAPSAPVSQPVKATETASRMDEVPSYRRHPKWDEGVEIFRNSIRNGVRDGQGLNTRDLADALKMKNRTLAGHIARYVRENG